MLATPTTVADPTATFDAAGLARATLERLEQAWNRADGAGFAAEFTEDCDFVNVLGTHIQGRPAVAAGHQGIFDSIYAGSVVAYRLESARVAHPGCVVAVSGGRLEVPGGPLQGTIDARLTLVLTEQADGWAVAAFHNTRVDEHA